MYVHCKQASYVRLHESFTSTQLCEQLAEQLVEIVILLYEYFRRETSVLRIRIVIR